MGRPRLIGILISKRIVRKGKAVKMMKMNGKAFLSNRAYKYKYWSRENCVTYKSTFRSAKSRFVRDATQLNHSSKL